MCLDIDNALWTATVIQRDLSTMSLQRKFRLRTATIHERILISERRVIFKCLIFSRPLFCVWIYTSSYNILWLLSGFFKFNWMTSWQHIFKFPKRSQSKFPWFVIVKFISVYIKLTILSHERITSKAPVLVLSLSFTTSHNHDDLKKDVYFVCLRHS